MVSEIEVVEEEGESRDHVALAAAPAVVEDESLMNDIYSATAYGDMEKLQRLVESDGCSVSEPDGLGYYAIQWAALNNRTVAAQYVIEHGGDINVHDSQGQTALHWSTVRGGIQAAELLLQEGARIDAADLNGYQGDTMKGVFKKVKDIIQRQIQNSNPVKGRDIRLKAALMARVNASDPSPRGTISFNI